jgi:aspartate/methionine/tyrosine aminotransferase
MTRISQKYGAVNLSQGFPDFDPPKVILDRLAEVAHEGFNQYSVTWGAQNFREALAAKQSRFMRADDRPEYGDRRDLRQHGGHDDRHDDGRRIRATK